MRGNQLAALEAFLLERLNKKFAGTPNTPEVRRQIAEETQELIAQFMRDNADEGETPALDAVSGGSGWWWLSFGNVVDGEPKFFGTAVVEACCLFHALEATNEAGINPGGIVNGGQLPKIDYLPEEYRNRLLTPAEAIEAKKLLDEGHRRAMH